jgi:ABC-type Na+ efflux pump permease subunit
MYGMNARDGHLSEDFFHSMLVTILFTMGLVSTVILSTTTITREKKAQSWPILLTMPLTSTQILMGKVIGSFLQGLPIWIVLAAHLLVFVVIGYIHPLALIQMTLIVFSVVSLMSGTGLYFSARFRKTTTAVVANLAVAIFLWALVPSMIAMATDWNDEDRRLHHYFTSHPFVQTSVVMLATAGRENAGLRSASLDYEWPPRDDVDGGAWEATGRLLFNGMLYVGVGAFCAWRAKTRVCRVIF